MTRTLFITATDTDAGKTRVAQGILQAAKRRGLSTLGYKPVSAGCIQTKNGLRNDDALILQRTATLGVPYEQVNPIAFADPVAPHLAAHKCGETIDMIDIERGFQHLLGKEADLLLVEGAGGWRLPLGQDRFMSDFVADTSMPVLLVIGLKLGCLNHALLTYQALLNDGVDIVGWVANQIDPNMLYLESNIAALQELIKAPCLGVIPQLQAQQSAEKFIDIDRILNQCAE